MRPNAASEDEEGGDHAANIQLGAAAPVGYEGIWERIKINERNVGVLDPSMKTKRRKERNSLFGVYPPMKTPYGRWGWGCME